MQGHPLKKQSIKIKLEAFEGPLDLLLHLIRVNEIEIFDIPIVEITEQYLEYIELMKEIDINVGSEFMVLAATLIHIKSKLMLPLKEDEEDPRKELVERLLGHQQYKDAANLLSEREARESTVYRSRPQRMYKFIDVEEEFVEVDIFQLIVAFQRVMKSIGLHGDYEIEHQQFSVDEKIHTIEGFLHERPRILFSNLAQDTRSKRELIATFLAILELIRRKVVSAAQGRNFGEIVIIALDQVQQVIEIKE